MDSLTQIVLGAACGEAVLGKKIGNKALLFGAIGGTIPDLDTFVGALLYTNEIDAMLFHRGFMHSILFSILGAFLFGWLTHKLYDSGKRKDSTIRVDWIKLFFWSLFTHILLDSFTPYGTQLFAPFFNYRAAFNNIAVADPLYTVPFITALIILMFYNRTHIRRRFWLKIGIGLSSFYMMLTLINRVYVASVFKDTFREKGIVSQRYSVQPTILNNILWYGIIETEHDYQIGFYSLLDSTKKFTDWYIIPKERALNVSDYKDVADLVWFSNGYYNITDYTEDAYFYKDLRYPLVETREGYKGIFNFVLFKEGQRLNMRPFAPDVNDFKYTMKALWTRLKGK